MHDIVTIRILGQEYKIKAGGSEERIQSLSRYVNQKVFDAQQQGKAVTTMELVTVVLLDMADEVEKAKAELEEYKESVSVRVNTLINKIDSGLK